MFNFECLSCSKKFQSHKSTRKYCSNKCVAEGNRVKEFINSKLCPVCNIDKPRSDYWKKKGSINALHWQCIECEKNVRHSEEYREKRRPLDKAKRRKYLGLDPNFEGNYKTGPKRNPETRTKSKNGYWLIYRPGHPNAQKSQKSQKGRIFEHVFIMSEHLGRPLKKDETVHHKNGIRDDNRVENLELWKKGQPPGSRAEDKLKWAKDLLEEYGYEVTKR